MQRQGKTELQYAEEIKIIILQTKSTNNNKTVSSYGCLCILYQIIYTFQYTEKHVIHVLILSTKYTKHNVDFFAS